MRHEMDLLLQEIRLSSELARDLIALIETSPYEQTTIELKLLELLACAKQKNRSLLLLIKRFGCAPVECQTLNQQPFSTLLDTLIDDWQQQKALCKLRQQILPSLKQYLQQTRDVELTYYQQLTHPMDNISESTSGAQGRSPHVQTLT
ncbi:hypothetical protein [Shewanella acanthi]|uniref:hypothetical protein n=1 Tax=Shewanella acanthi TaxID=2864212 RepID=UPI001C661F37|nr:hypothetical protein [Shewanella acanthi]QYJ80303.1 hypothetical protein K0H61_07990 [Shewanella acanthi]